MRQQPKLTAFTLIELLVVIAILGLLISILIPSLSAARCESKKTACLAHIKAITTTGLVYEADDSSGFAIPVHELFSQQFASAPSYIGAYEWGGKAGVGRPGWTEGPDSGEFAFLSSRYGTQAGFGPSTRPMNILMFPGGFKDNLRPMFDRNGAGDDTRLELDVYSCPGDDGPPRGAHERDWIANTERSSYDHFGTSYAANTFFVSKQDSLMYSNSPFLRPVTRVPNPGKTLLFEENIGRWAWACRNEPAECGGGGIDPGPTKSIKGWHCREWTFNRSFVDGHAEPQTIVEFDTVDSDGFFNHFRTEQVFKDPAVQGFFQCLIVRGEGWQKDALPDLPVETGLAAGDGREPTYEDMVSPSSNP
ncbi:MAG: prepilin-type N-terminal cleavage/methylation domain-containing protein [Phycisphaerae bacterium]